jgi:choline dehydrogenase-like flavoprotein
MGVPVQVDLPGVGAHLHDHPDVAVVHSLPGTALGVGVSLPGLQRIARGAWEWRQHRTGMLTSNLAEAGGFIRSRPQSRKWICSCILCPASWSTMAGVTPGGMVSAAMSVCCNPPAGASCGWPARTRWRRR